MRGRKTLENGCGLIWGNLCSMYWRDQLLNGLNKYSRTFGFIVLICSLVGVPRTLMISTNWSIPDSPGNNGCPNISSAITQPVDQMSACRSDHVSAEWRYSPMLVV